MKIYSAIEIDYKKIKILEIYKKRRGYFLNNFINYEIENADTEDAGLISANLNKIIVENKISQKNIIASLNGNKILSFNFTLPNMPTADFKSAVEYELKKVLHFPITQYIFDYIYVSYADDSGNIFLNLTAFAALEKDVKNFLEIFDKASIKVKYIECKAVSIYNNAKYMGKIWAGGAKHILLCDISYYAIKILMILNEGIVFERTVEDLNFKNISYENSLSVIVDELKRTLDFYFAGKSLPPIDEIILSGIFSKKKGFDMIISKVTGFKSFSVTMSDLLESGDYRFYLSEKINKLKRMNGSYFLNPLEEMWTTFGLIVNR
ncbi:MAG: pilus assembly protein PilM [Deltaproteobacteria bacterium]|jgi:Tfp pilus assembly PilM family ATPase|nr:pilus assembly protein PilM [Deltaproteobacteria bacterium]MCL6119938.1 pilus assembly protein PilM [Deltaproteobacteria bacterium]